MTENILAKLPPIAFRGQQSGKYAPKLTHAERCSMLALVLSGVRREVVALAFGVDRRTVGHVVNSASSRYREVRNQYKGEGHDEFIAKYLTEEVALRVARAAKEFEAGETDAKPVDHKAPQPRSNRMAGIHRVKPDQCEYEHRVEIGYLPEGPYGPGWYFKDLDSKENPDTWFHNGDDSRRTSQACYDEMLANLMDD